MIIVLKIENNWNFGIILEENNIFEFEKEKFFDVMWYMVRVLLKEGY